MVDDLYRAGEARAAPTARPDFVPAANRHGQHERARFECDARRARFELVHRAISTSAPAFGKNDERAAAPQPLKRTTNGARVAALNLQRPRAEPAHQPAHHRPTETYIPSEKAKRAFDWHCEPERIDVGLMIGRDDEPTVARDVLRARVAHAPEQTEEQARRPAQTFKRPSRQHERLRPARRPSPVLAPTARHARPRPVHASSAPVSRAPRAVASRHAVLSRATTSSSSVSACVS